MTERPTDAALARTATLARERTRGRHHLALAGCYFLLFLLCYSPWNGRGVDEAFYYAHVASPAFDGDLDFANDVAGANNEPDLARELVTRLVAATGQPIDSYAVGNGLLWLPFVGLTRGYALLLDALNVAPGPSWNWRSDRYSIPYLNAMSLGTWTYGYLTLVLTYEACRRRFRSRASLWAALASLGGSQLLGYDMALGGMSHAHSAFASALFLWVVIRHRRLGSWRDFAAMGAALGLATLIRWQEVILALIPGALLVQSIVAGRQRGAALAGRCVAGAVGFLGAFSLQCAYWRATHGHLFTMPQGGGYMFWSAPEALGVLLAGWHGFFYCHPLMLLGLAGLAGVAAWPGARRASRARISPLGAGRLLALGMLFYFAAETYINASVNDWMAMGSFGHRRFCGVVPMLGFGLAGTFQFLRRRRLEWLGAALALLATFANVAYLAAFTRELADPAPWNEAFALRHDWMRHASWLLTLPLSSYCGANFFGERGDPNLALGVALAALALLASAWVVGREMSGLSGAGAGRRRPAALWWLTGRMAAGVAALGYGLIVAWVIAHKPLPDRDALLATSPLAKNETPASRVPFLRQALAAPSPHLATVLVALNTPDAALRRRATAVAYQQAPHLWARVVTELLGPEEVAPMEKMAAATLPLNVHALNDISVAITRVARRLPEERRIDATRRYLWLYPMAPGELQKLSELLREAGRDGEAEEADSLTIRIDEARIAIAESYRGNSRGWWRQLLVGGPHQKSLVEVLERRREWEKVARVAMVGYEAAAHVEGHPQRAWMRRHWVEAEARWLASSGRLEQLPPMAGKLGDMGADDYLAVLKALAEERYSKRMAASGMSGLPGVVKELLEAATRLSPSGELADDLKRQAEIAAAP